MLRRFFFTIEPCKEFYKYALCTKDTYRGYVNQYLQTDMSLENYGTLWELDHIVPVELFDLDNEENLKLCYSRFNIIPLYKKHNKAKGSSIHFSFELINSRLKKDPENECLIGLHQILTKEKEKWEIYLN